MGDMSTQLPKWHVHLPSGGLKSGSRPPLRRRGASDALYGDDCGVYVGSEAVMCHLVEEMARIAFFCPSCCPICRKANRIAKQTGV